MFSVCMNNRFRLARKRKTSNLVKSTTKSNYFKRKFMFYIAKKTIYIYIYTNLRGKLDASPFFLQDLQYLKISEILCSRKNFVFLFGVLINLTVRVDTYFHPIRMTYRIHPGPFFRTAPNWGKAAKHSLPQKLSNWTNVLLSALLL